MKREDALKRFNEGLIFPFGDEALLSTVFVHSSYLNEKGGAGLESNERLEFLGDAVLSVVVSRLLYLMFPESREGELTSMRARLVNRQALAEVARGLRLGELILLGKGEKKSGGDENDNILSDTFEALIGAMSLSGGYKKTYGFIKRLFSERIKASVGMAGYFDYKPKFQEVVQRHFKEPPFYRLVKEEGPPHRRFFSVEAGVGGKTLGKGSASRKKDAEQESARQALETLKSSGYT